MNIARTTRIYYTNNDTTPLNAQRDCGLLTFITRTSVKNPIQYEKRK